MATLKLKKKPGAAPEPSGERRAPVRGKGVSRPRQTLQAAQAERAERQAAFEQRRAEETQRNEAPARGKPSARPGDRPGDRPGRPGDRPNAKPGNRPGAKSAGDFRRDEGPRFEERRPPRRQDEGPARGDRGPYGDRGPQGGRGPRSEGPGERPRFEPRGDGPGRQDNRRGEGPARRPDGRFESRQDPRQEGRQDNRQEPRRDQRRATGPRPGPAGGPARPYPPQPRAAPARRAPLRDDDDDDDDDFRDPSSEGERLSKRMGVLGLASRREADEWIAAGWVRVDGKLAVLGQRVGPDAKIEVDQAAHKEQAKQVTILLHKPIGYVSGQAEDGYEPASVLVRSANHWKDDPSGIKYHIGHSRSLAPAGRLDIDSTGLLVLTQDGRIAKLLIGEDSKIEKEYLVRVEYQGEGSPMERFPAQDLALLNHGLELDGVQLKPAKVSWQNEDQLRFVLREGRKRQIRRMCEQVGLTVVGLKRVRIGRINLGHLPPGQWRYLTPWERFD